LLLSNRKYHKHLLNNINVAIIGHNVIRTVEGSSKGSSISEYLRKTFPLQALHRTRSKTGTFSLKITPATNLNTYSKKIKRSHSHEKIEKVHSLY